MAVAGLVVAGREAGCGSDGDRSSFPKSYGSSSATPVDGANVSELGVLADDTTLVSPGLEVAAVMSEKERAPAGDSTVGAGFTTVDGDRSLRTLHDA